MNLMEYEIYTLRYRAYKSIMHFLIRAWEAAFSRPTISQRKDISTIIKSVLTNLTKLTIFVLL